MADAILVSTVNKLLLHTPKGDFTVADGFNFPSATWDEERFYVACRKKGPSGNGVMVFDRGFRLVKHVRFNAPGTARVRDRDFFISGLHENFYWDGRVYFANTGYNSIVAWDEKRGIRLIRQEPPVQRPMPKWDAAKDNHLNSIWCDGKNFYIVEHRNGPSKIKVFTLDWQQLVRTHEIGNQCHNVYVENNTLYVCTSWYHAVAARDLSTNAERWIQLKDYLDWVPKFFGEEFIHHAYPRGLGRTEDKWFVGLSATVKRGDRQKGDSCIIVFDNDWQKIDEIVLDETGGIGTGGVRIMDETDRAHNRIPCPWDGTIKGKGIL